MHSKGFAALVAAGVLTGSLALQALTPPPGQAQAQAALVARGQFGGAIDPVHHVDGTASIYRLRDGARVLRLENFKSTNGTPLRRPAEESDSGV